LNERASSSYACGVSDAPHPLLELYLASASGRFPPVDGTLRVLPALPGGLEASIGFTGHALVCTALEPSAVHARGVDAFGGSLGPAFLCWLAGEGGRIGSLDVTLVGRGRGQGHLVGETRCLSEEPRRVSSNVEEGPSADCPIVPGSTCPSPAQRGRGEPGTNLGHEVLARRHDLDEHPRVRLARGQRQGVEVYGDERGLVTLSNGLAGRRELSIEVASEEQGRGHGRALLGDALGLVLAGEPVFAAVAAGNARSLRAFLALGFVAVGCEVLLRPRRGASGEPDATPF
jgi:GNAT superfamily N-acetyltransferase